MPNSSVSCLFFHAYIWIPSALHYLDIYLDLQLFFCFFFFTGLICCNWNAPSLLIYIFPSLPPVDYPLGVLGCQWCLPHRKLFAMKS